MEGDPDVTLMLADSDIKARFTPPRLTRGWLRIGARVFASGPQSRHNNLRVLLVADVLRRVVEDLHAGHVQLGMLLPSTAGRADDRLRMALPFAPETFGIRPSTEVGDHLDAAVESLGQRRDCGTPPYARETTPHSGPSDVTSRCAPAK
jgi:hypothetical protein